MRNFLRSLMLALLAGTLAACGNAIDEPVAGAVEVRVQNATTATLTDVRLAWPESELRISRLAPNEVSAYEPRSGAYRYGYLRVLANGVEKVLQPIDYVGESPLAPGRYTYVISTSTYQSDRVDLQVVQDP